MMRKRVYSIIVREVTTELDDDGTTPTLAECASWSGEADCPWCAVRAWSEQLDAEDAS